MIAASNGHDHYVKSLILDYGAKIEVADDEG